ncbi:MAG: hypothetical protein OQK55_08290 [Thermoanaerobaculales bacterium]|nr:hypothetical protein [Thermoanaerobaculales bacterium]
MKGLIRYAAPLAAAALFLPEYGFTEQPQARVAADARAPKAAVWTARAPDIARMRSRPGVMVPMVEAGGEAPRNVGVERPGTSEIEKEDCGDGQAVVDEGAFLRPTWNRGFWVMPPGGLTRFLLPAPGFINPDETVAGDPVIANSG